MSLTRLHPYFRDLPYSSLTPDESEFSGETGYAFYQGFISTANNCCIPYKPLRVLISAFCCNDQPHLFVAIIGKKGKRWQLNDEVAIWKLESNSLILVSEFCRDSDLPISDSITLSDYQSRLLTAFSNAESTEGFTLDQTLFWDLNPDVVCPCIEPSGGCPEGTEWDLSQCACIPTEACLDLRTVNLRISLKPTVDVATITVKWYNKSKQFVRYVQVNIGIAYTIPVLEMPLFTYEANGNMLLNSFIPYSDRVASAILDGFIQYASIELLGPAGEVISDLIDAELFTTTIHREYDEAGYCICPQPETCVNWDEDNCQCLDGDCPPGYHLDNGICIPNYNPPQNASDNIQLAVQTQFKIDDNLNSSSTGWYNVGPLYTYGEPSNYSYSIIDELSDCFGKDGCYEFDPSEDATICRRSAEYGTFNRYHVKISNNGNDHTVEGGYLSSVRGKGTGADGPYDFTCTSRYVIFNLKGGTLYYLDMIVPPTPNDYDAPDPPPEANCNLWEWEVGFITNVFPYETTIVHKESLCAIPSTNSFVDWMQRSDLGKVAFVYPLYARTRIIGTCVCP